MTWTNLSILMLLLSLYAIYRMVRNHIEDTQRKLDRVSRELWSLKVELAKKKMTK